MAKLKYHEKKLLKHVDFHNWEVDNSLHENKIIRKYRILKREQYTLYNKLSREIRNQIRTIRDLPPKDKFRAYATTKMLDKLYNIGLISTKESLQEAEKVTASAFCRRRLPWVMVKLRMAQGLKMATQYIQQGHVRIGPDICLDESRIVSREHEDLVTWCHKSKIRTKIDEYNDERDDYDLYC